MTLSLESVWFVFPQNNFIPPLELQVHHLELLPILRWPGPEEKENGHAQASCPELHAPELYGSQLSLFI